MKLSVVIVNYNVQHFLDQCLYAVLQAAKNIETEVFVVDNNSVDGSNTMVRKKYPGVQLIENKRNVGFSKANNQAIRVSQGQYILLLNPDTVVQEDTFEKCIGFMDNNHLAGALGVRMIDGKGNFLPESKRAMPSPWVAFYKIFGLARLFPKSHKFGKYHLTYLPQDKVNEVDILPGAFMLMRKEALDKAGLLDEDFFMYGEDIDLSYRIRLAGYKNYYYPETTIIHYKGESTKKTSVNYVYVFYNAMLIFARKHFTGNHVKWFSLLINMAVYFRAGIALIRRFINSYLLQSIDLISFFSGFYLLAKAWGTFFFKNPGHYSTILYQVILPIYALVWIVSIYLTGGYDKPVKLNRVLKGILSGTVVILIIYALLPLHLRFSRALILLGALWAMLIAFATKYLLGKAMPEQFKFEIKKRKKRFVIIGEPNEIETIARIIGHNSITAEYLALVTINEMPDNQNAIGTIDNISEIVEINKIDEIIFSAKTVPAKTIIKTMIQLGAYALEYKIASPNGISIIGSSSINTSGDLYAIDINSVVQTVNIRKKRIFDLAASIIILLLSPLLMFSFKNKLSFGRNILLVLTGKYSFVGIKNENANEELKVLKKGILTPVDLLNNKHIEHNETEKVNILYARDYKIGNDIKILFKAFNKLSRNINNG